MPAHVVGRLAERLGDLTGLRVAVLGAAYRGGVKETAFSGVFATVRALRDRGAVPTVHDPMYSDDELAALGFAPHHLGDGGRRRRRSRPTTPSTPTSGQPTCPARGSSSTAVPDCALDLGDEPEVVVVGVGTADASAAD